MLAVFFHVLMLTSYWSCNYNCSIGKDYSPSPLTMQMKWRNRVLKQIWFWPWYLFWKAQTKTCCFMLGGLLVASVMIIVSIYFREPYFCYLQEIILNDKLHFETWACNVLQSPVIQFTQLTYCQAECTPNNSKFPHIFWLRGDTYLSDQRLNAPDLQSKSSRASYES